MPADVEAEGPLCRIRFRGRVQGVGFRPTVWRVARAMGLDGAVKNDADGVEVTLAGGRAVAERFVERMHAECPPLALIESVEIVEAAGRIAAGFVITTSGQGRMATEVTPDAVTCADCLAEIADPTSRRYRYPFTNCTNCGPRLTIVTSAPYDRPRTTMAGFPMCVECRSEYEDPADRRFHAQPIACPTCGPRLHLEPTPLFDSAMPHTGDAVRDIAELLQRGAIVAIKGLGGYQLAVRAGDASAVERLRQRKRRPGKPFALMVKDVAMARTVAEVNDVEARLMMRADGPIVLLDGRPGALPDAIAPGLTSLGLMLPNTALHHMLLADLAEPIVLTSGNLSHEPQITDDDAARSAFGPIADVVAVHDRPIAVRLDDSVLRMVSGKPLVLRRGRGQAPAPIRMPRSFAEAPPLTALGGDLKNAFCLLNGGHAVLSQHIGDLEEALTLADGEAMLTLYDQLYDHRPEAIAVDLHPGYHASRLGADIARARGIPLIEVRHHHAHAASVMADNGFDLGAPKLLSLAIDGTGLGEDGEIWGGELLLADFSDYVRVGGLRPVALPGGDRAAVEPWRNLVAAILDQMDFQTFRGRYGRLEIAERLAARPVATLAAMIAKGLNSPPASSTGRLFDAVAAALLLVEGAQTYEAEAAMRLEALVSQAEFDGLEEAEVYPFDILPAAGSRPAMLCPRPMWRALFADLMDGVPASRVSARFHKGLARGFAGLARFAFDHCGIYEWRIGLSGGSAQNVWLAEETIRRLNDAGFEVFTQGQVPANDGGLALGQAVIAAARLMR
ncbi:MAG: carbamoyltransferase HypF [Ancalomicrobiaceae bacterium]|nr:carbamoyltransferase HypF [Ancalomicrobiaceae bacterium]